MRIKLKKLNTKGFSHHLLIPVIAIVAIAGIGAYVVTRSKAATCTNATTCETVVNKVSCTMTNSGPVSNTSYSQIYATFKNPTNSGVRIRVMPSQVFTYSAGGTFTWKGTQAYDYGVVNARSSKKVGPMGQGLGSGYKSVKYAFTSSSPAYGCSTTIYHR